MKCFSHRTDKHQEMENKVCRAVSAKLQAHTSEITNQNIINKCNEFCKEVAEEMGLRHYLAGSTNFLFYDENHCIKADWLSNPQVQAIEIAEDIIKLQQELGSAVHID